MSYQPLRPRIFDREADVSDNLKVLTRAFAAEGPRVSQDIARFQRNTSHARVLRAARRRVELRDELVEVVGEGWLLKRFCWQRCVDLLAVREVADALRGCLGFGGGGIWSGDSGDGSKTMRRFLPRVRLSTTMPRPSASTTSVTFFLGARAAFGTHLSRTLSQHSSNFAASSVQ